MPHAGQEQQTAEYPINENGRAYAPGLADDEKSWAMFAHLGLLGHAILPGISIGIPIVIWLSKRADSDFIDDHGREAVNFQITLFLYSVVLPVVVGLFGILTCGIGLLLLIPVAFLPYVLGIVGMIMASVAANRGEFFRYPMTFRFIK